MPEYQAVVTVTLKPEILDPAGEATAGVLRHMGYTVADLRIGRHIRVVFEAKSREDAVQKAEQMAEELLAHPVMETYQVSVEDS